MASVLTANSIDGYRGLFLFRETDRAIARRQRQRLNAAVALAASLIGGLFVIRVDWPSPNTNQRVQPPIAVHLDTTPGATDTAVSVSPSTAEQEHDNPENAQDEAVMVPRVTDAAETAADESRAPPAPPIERRDEPLIDWAAELQREARAMAELERPEDDYFYFSNNRREREEAAIKYAPVAPPKRIWDNVEKDIYGRTILRSGNCYRVLDDPRATNRWAFETFEQFLVFCDPVAKGPKKLPWVETIREMYGMDEQH